MIGGVISTEKIFAPNREFTVLQLRDNLDQLGMLKSKQVQKIVKEVPRAEGLVEDEEGSVKEA